MSISHSPTGLFYLGFICHSIDHVEMSKSDSEMHARKHKPSSMQETSGSSNSKRRIQLNLSGRSGKRPPLDEQLPLTHTIPRITVDALSDAKYLLHLNDNPSKVYQEQNDRSLSNAVPGYMESRVKAHGIRRALAPLTNVYGSHPWAQQTDKSSIHSHRHQQMEHARRDVPVKYSSNCDTLGLHPFTRNVRITESFGGLHEPASFANQRQSNNVIATNQVHFTYFSLNQIHFILRFNLMWDHWFLTRLLTLLSVAS